MSYEVYVDNKPLGYLSYILEELNGHEEAVIILENNETNRALVQENVSVTIKYCGKTIFTGTLFGVKYSPEKLECMVYNDVYDKLKNSIIEKEYPDPTSPSTILSDIASAAGVTAGECPSTPTVSVRFDKTVCMDAVKFLCDLCDKDFYTTDGTTINIGTRGSSKGEIEILSYPSKRTIDRSSVKNHVIIRGVDKDGNVIYGEAQTGAGDRVVVFVEKKASDVATLNKLAQRKLAELQKETVGSKLIVENTVGMNLEVGDTITVIKEDLGFDGDYRIYRIKRKEEQTEIEIDRPEVVLEQFLVELKNLEELGIYPGPVIPVGTEVEEKQLPVFDPSQFSASFSTVGASAWYQGTIFKLQAHEDGYWRLKEVAFEAKRTLSSTAGKVEIKVECSFDSGVSWTQYGNIQSVETDTWTECTIAQDIVGSYGQPLWVKFSFRIIVTEAGEVTGYLRDCELRRWSLYTTSASERPKIVKKVLDTMSFSDAATKT